MAVARANGFVHPCIPTLAAKPPSGPDWVHEIKHDGYRLIVRRDGRGAGCSGQSFDCARRLRARVSMIVVHGCLSPM